MTDQSQQDREAFEKWCTHTDVLSIATAWQAALAYERGKNGESLLTMKPITYKDWDGEVPVIIIHDESGEEWHNQSGGCACYHPMVKGNGFLLPYFSGECICCNRDDYAGMQAQLDKARLPVHITGGDEADLKATAMLNGEEAEATIFYSNCD